MGCTQSTRRDSVAESNELHGRGADGWEAGARSSAAFLKVQARPPVTRSTGSTGSGPLRPSYATACSSNTLPAFVLCDFDAEPGSAELSVRRGQFVDVFVGELPSPPEGWCTCQIRGKASPAEDARGLVPWTHVVSAVHAELDAIAEEQTEDRVEQSEDGGSPQRRSSLTEPERRSSLSLTEESSAMWAHSRSVPVRRTDRGFGIDVSERNVLVRIVPDSAAGDDGLLFVGDVILSVDGEPLAGRWLSHLLKTLPKRDVHTFVVIAEADLAPAAAAEISSSRSFFRKSNKGSSRGSRGGPTGASPVTGRSGQEYDILSTIDLRNIYALKSWAIDDLKRPACDYQYFSFEGRDVPIGLEGLPSATAAADAATRGGTVCAPSEVISAASRLQSSSGGGGGRAAPSSPRGADPDLAAAKLFGSLDPLAKGPVPVHALWLVDVNDDLVSGAMAVALDRAVSEQGRSAAQIVARLNALRRGVPFELVCMSMRSRGGGSSGGSSKRPKYPPSLERLGCEVEVAVGGGTTDSASSSRFFGYTRKEAALVLATMRSHGVTHVWVGGLAPEGAVLVSALHAAEAGLCTVVLSDCSRACSLACGSADTSLLAKASINLVESTDVKPLRALASAKDTAAAASMAAAVGAIVASIGADTGRAPLAEETLDPASAVYRIAGDTVPAWVFAQLQQKATRQHYQQEQIDLLAKEQQEEEQLRAQEKQQQQQERDEREQHEQAALAVAAAAPLKLQREAQPGASADSSAAPTATRDAGPPGHSRQLSAGGRKLAEKSRPFWETKDTRKHREPPKPAMQVGTMRMDEMLEEARRGALADGTAEATAHFELLLERYRKHPSVQRREREAADVAAREAAEEAEALESQAGTALAESSAAQEASDARDALAMALEVSAGAVAFSAAVEERRLSQRSASPMAMQSPQLAPMVAMPSPSSCSSSPGAFPFPPVVGAALPFASLASSGETGLASGSARGHPPAGPSRCNSLDEPPHGTARDSRGDPDSMTARWGLGRNSRGSKGSRSSKGSRYGSPGSRSSRGSQDDCSSSEEEMPAPSPSGRMPIVRINTPKLNLGKVREAEESRADASHQKAHAVLLATLAEGESSVGSTLTNPSEPASARRGSSTLSSRPASARGGSSGADGADGAEGNAAMLSMVELDMAAVPELSGEVPSNGGTLKPSQNNSVSSTLLDPIPKPPHILFSLDLAGRDEGALHSPLKQLRRSSSVDAAYFAALGATAADTEEVSICSLSTSGRDSAAARASTASRYSSDSHGSTDALPLPVGIPIPISTGTTPTRGTGSESRKNSATPTESKAGDDPSASPIKSPGHSASRKGKGYARKTVLTKHLGAGSCGSVYIGLCNGEEVAVKVLPLEDDTAEAVKREIRILRECDCEHIVAYKDAFMREYQMRPTLWVVMEFCHGGSLLDVMRKMGSAFPEPCIATICMGVLKALDYMHVQRKAIHRDIKSANVLLTADGRVKLADLGVVAQLFNTMSKRGTMIGTPHWMAPETLGLSGGAAGYDTKVDIWSLGVTAIECAEQKPPFSNTTSIYETMMHIVQGPPATLAPETHASDDFAAFIAAALVKNPTERPSASDLLEHAFLKRGSHEELKGIVQYVLGGNPLDNITTI